MTNSIEPSPDVATLVEIVRRLRDPNSGCAWHRQQTFDTIAPYTIEEAYEVAGDIVSRDWVGLKSELGDLLFNVVYHAALAEERGLFALSDVVEASAAKMIQRRQDIFGTTPASAGSWERAKADERAARGETGTLDGISQALPALVRADKLQKRLSTVGFDWHSPDLVLDKIVEEAREIVEAKDSGTQDEIAGEIGDLLFAVANLARHLKVDPEAALRMTNAKVARRWVWIEAQLSSQNRKPADASLEELEALWQQAKASTDLSTAG